MISPATPATYPQRRKRILLAGAGTLIVAGLVLLVQLDARPESLPSLELAVVGDAELMFNTGTIAERPALVNFWASWCIACRTEHAQLLALTRDGSLRVFGINHRDSREDAERWLAFYGDPFELSVFDPDGVIAEHFSIEALPVTLVIDSGGRVRYRHDGPLDTVSAETIIRPLMQELVQEN